MTSSARFDGIAKPMPTLPPDGEKIIELMPTSSPRRFTSGPPELPGLIEASVWMKFCTPEPPRPVRPSAETMPEVTVWPRPNGSPTATTKSPTRSFDESATGSAVSFSAGICSTAISESGSVPSTFALTVRPSATVTEMSSAPSTTWLLVST